MSDTNNLDELQQRAQDYLKARAEDIWKHFGPTWLDNVRRNIPQINETITGHQLTDCFVSPHGYKKRPTSALVFAPGASLMKYEPYMHFLAPLLMKQLVIATPTVLPWMRRHNVEPDILIVADSHPNQSDPITKTGGAKSMRLLCPPIVDRSVVKAFPRAQTYWYNSIIMDENLSIEGNDFSQYMLMLLQPVQSFIVQAGSVTNQAVMAVRSAVDMGVLPTLKRITLVGADHAYWRGLGRTPFYELIDDGWVEGTYRKAMKEHDSVVWDGMETNKRMIMYKRNLLFFWSQTLTPIYSCSEGILNEFPYVDLFDVAQDRYPPYPSKTDIYEAAAAFINEQFPTQFPLTLKEYTNDSPSTNADQGSVHHTRQIRVKAPSLKELL